MNTLEGLLAGIVADPLEETRWLVLADWLEEFDDPRRAELLRLHRKMLATCCDGWSVECGGTDPVLPSTRHPPPSTVREPSDHPDRAEWQARMVALIADGVRPCVPQKTITLPSGGCREDSGGWRVERGGIDPALSLHPPPVTLHDLPLHPPRSTLSMTFSFIPPGSFLMGSDHPEGYDEEKPVHRVTLTKGFFLGTHPVTQAQWKAITDATPSYFKGDNRPVERVSWDDCQLFCEKLTAHLGGRGTVCLPSEAEWEYACRAGTTTEFHFGDVITPDLVNYDGNGTWNGSLEGKYREETTEVGSFPANPWGLFDMHGNVWEWCQDWSAPYSADDQLDPIQLTEQSDECAVLRGGCWKGDPSYCRSAYRDGDAPLNRLNGFGFRCVLRLV
jgi:uncharacterized protein (TIGR02996 family)